MYEGKTKMRQGRAHLWVLAAVALTVSLALAAPAAATKRGCVKAVGSSTLANDHSQSAQAIVLRKGGKLYGCSFDRERAHELPGQDDGGQIVRSTVVVKARNAAYGNQYHGGGHVTTIVWSVKLRSGKAWAASDDVPYGEDVDLQNLELRPNGSIGWMFAWPAGNPGRSGAYTVVLGFDHGAGGSPRYNKYGSDNEDESDADPEHPIVQHSLRLLHDGLGETGWRLTFSREGAATGFFDVH